MKASFQLKDVSASGTIVGEVTLTVEYTAEELEVAYTKAPELIKVLIDVLQRM